MKKLDLHDPEVREMADFNHKPEEMWSMGGEVYLFCAACRQMWPCPTRVELREMERLGAWSPEEDKP